MHGGMKVKKDQEENESPLNKEDLEDDSPRMNRGFELLLRNKKRREPPKTLEFKFGKALSIFGRRVEFFLDTHIDVRKKED